MGIAQSIEGFYKTIKKKKGEFGSSCLTAELPHWSSFAICTPGSEAFGLWLNTTSSPGSPACKQQIMRLLSLHNCMSQFLILHISLIGSVSLENPNTLIQEPPNIFLQKLHHFTFVPAMYEDFNITTSTLSNLFFLNFCGVFTKIIAILIAVKQYLVIVLICIFLTTNDVEHLTYACWPFVYLFY